MSLCDGSEELGSWNREGRDSSCSNPREIGMWW
jgi:hypothetical protein